MHFEIANLENASKTKIRNEVTDAVTNKLNSIHSKS